MAQIDQALRQQEQGLARPAETTQQPVQTVQQAVQQPVGRQLPGYIDIARQNMQGAEYSQAQRGSKGFYDCSSFVGRTLQQAGYNVNPLMTTASMPTELTKAGWKQMTFNPNDLQPGDILWRKGHTEIYTGDGKSIGARNPRKGVNEWNMFDRNGKDYMGYTHIFRMI